MEKNVPIRAISRCISVLQAINKSESLTMREIADDANVPYATAVRIVQTLQHEGLVEREPARLKYRPTALVQSLSQRFQSHDRLVAAARPHMVRLTEHFMSPFAVATPVGRQMMIRDCTHSAASRAWSVYYPGYSVPMLDSAAGQAYLAFAHEAESEALLQSLCAPLQGDLVGDVCSSVVGEILADVRVKGYAAMPCLADWKTSGKTWSMATPVFEQSSLAGVLIMSYSVSDRLHDEAQLADSLMQAAETISESIRRN